MWTVSDPAYAAVNGEDLLPDLALGRLPAQSLEQARALVQKVQSIQYSFTLACLESAGQPAHRFLGSLRPGGLSDPHGEGWVVWQLLGKVGGETG